MRKRDYLLLIPLVLLASQCIQAQQTASPRTPAQIEIDTFIKALLPKVTATNEELAAKLKLLQSAEKDATNYLSQITAAEEKATREAEKAHENARRVEAKIMEQASGPVMNSHMYRDYRRSTA